MYIQPSHPIQAETLLGCSSLEGVDAAKNAVSQFYQKHALSGCVLLTLGSQGLVYAANATSPVEHVPAETVTTLDTTVSKVSYPLHDRIVWQQF